MKLRSKMNVPQKRSLAEPDMEDEEESYFESGYMSGKEGKDEERVSESPVYEDEYEEDSDFNQYGDEEDVEAAADDETYSNEQTAGKSETAEELKDRLMAGDKKDIIDHDEDSDEYTDLFDEQTNEDLEMPMAKKMRLAFMKKQFDQKFMKQGGKAY